MVTVFCTSRNCINSIEVAKEDPAIYTLIDGYICPWCSETDAPVAQECAECDCSDPTADYYLRWECDCDCHIND